MKFKRICLFLLFLCSCEPNEPVLPIVETLNPTSITLSTAQLNGALVLKGSEPISDVGFIWAATPGISEKKGEFISLGAGNEIGSFESTLEGTKRGNKYYYVAYAKVSDQFFLGKEIEFTAGAHTITSVLPNSVLPGGNVSIVGTDFVSDVSKLKVTIGNIVIPVDAATETQIDVTLPTDISGGNKSVKVEIEGIEVSSHINVKTILETISASWGFAGDTITISGIGFGTIEEVQVRFNDKMTTVTSTNFNAISFLVPVNAAGVNKIRVDVNSVPSSNEKTFNVLAWKKLTDVPFEARFGSSSFVIDNKLYVGLGSNHSNERFNDFWKVDLQTGKVSQLNDFPEEVRFAAISFAIGSKGYVVLGYNGNIDVVKALWEYDPTLDKWTLKSPFPGNGRSGAVSFVLNGKAYVGCGISNGITSLKDMYQYDSELDKWTAVTDFAGGPIYGQGSFVVGNKAYVVTGVKNNNVIVRDFWEFDGSNWTQRADYPGGLATGGYGYSYNNVGFFGFGWVDGNTADVENWRYKPSSNRWKRVEDFPGPGRFEVISGSTEKVWYFGLGEKVTTAYKDLWIVELP